MKNILKVGTLAIVLGFVIQSECVAVSAQTTSAKKTAAKTTTVISPTQLLQNIQTHLQALQSQKKVTIKPGLQTKTELKLLKKHLNKQIAALPQTSLNRQNQNILFFNNTGSAINGLNLKCGSVLLVQNNIALSNNSISGIFQPSQACNAGMSVMIGSKSALIGASGSKKSNVQKTINPAGQVTIIMIENKKNTLIANIIK